MCKSMTERNLSIAPLYLFIKNHKGWSEEMGTPLPSGPMCSGNRGFNKHLGELVLILESISHATSGADVNSTVSFLEKIE